MRKKREFIEGVFYHVTSRTNDKIRVFDNNLGRKIMLITLQDANIHALCLPPNFHSVPTPKTYTISSVISYIFLDKNIN